MNIFILSLNPYLCALYHNDKHVVKMILETAQMLCITHYLCSNCPSEYLYKRTKAFVNHPSTRWIRQSRGNYIWTYLLFRNLCNEYTFRYNKIHLCETKFMSIFNTIPELLPPGNMTPFALAMPDDVKHSNPIVAYRNYYKKYKKGFCVWSKRNTPPWYSPE